MRAGWLVGRKSRRSRRIERPIVQLHVFKVCFDPVLPHLWLRNVEGVRVSYLTRCLRNVNKS